MTETFNPESPLFHHTLVKMGIPYYHTLVHEPGHRGEVYRGLLVPYGSVKGVKLFSILGFKRGLLRWTDFRYLGGYDARLLRHLPYGTLVRVEVRDDDGQPRLEAEVLEDKDDEARTLRRAEAMHEQVISDKIMEELFKEMENDY